MGKLIDESTVLVELGLANSVTELQMGVVILAVQRAEGAIIRHLKYDPVQRVRTEFYPRHTPAGALRGVWESNDSEAFLRRVSHASTSELQLMHLPIRATDSDGNNAIDLRIDYDGRNGTKSGGFAAATQKTEGTDFWPNYDGEDSNSIAYCRDGIIRSDGLWPDEPGSVKVTYVGGYTDAELAGQDTILDASPITDVAISEASRRVRKALTMKDNSRIGTLAGPLTMERLGDYQYKQDSSVVRALFGDSGDKSLTSDSREQLSDFVHYGSLLA